MIVASSTPFDQLRAKSAEPDEVACHLVDLAKFNELRANPCYNAKISY